VALGKSLALSEPQVPYGGEMGILGTY
jgi:hypothetical protein